MTQYGFYFDSTRCTGCKTCELACKDYHDLGTDILFRRVYDFEGGDWTQDENGAWANTAFMYHVSNSCNHCEEPACVGVCPTGAMTKDPDNGLVTSNREVCIGCGSCANACPYTAPRVDESLSVCRKCDGCLTRVENGLKPICVDACLLRCLEFDDIEALREKYGDLADIAPLPEASQTSPSLVIKAPENAQQWASQGWIGNPMEVS